MRLLPATNATLHTGPTRARTWPPAHPAQLPLLAASAAVIVGSFLPWVVTGIGSYQGIAGPGLWTFYAGILGVAGGLVPHRRLAIAQGLVTGVAAIALPAWQVLRLATRVGFTGWQPGFGLAMVFVAGVAALRATSRMRPVTG